jgi:hypothetical protein
VTRVCCGDLLDVGGGYGCVRDVRKGGGSLESQNAPMEDTIIADGRIIVVNLRPVIAKNLNS